MRRFLSLVNRRQLRRVLQYMLARRSFKSSHGISRLSRSHKVHPLRLHLDGIEHRVDYEPAESTTGNVRRQTPTGADPCGPVNFF